MAAGRLDVLVATRPDGGVAIRLGGKPSTTHIGQVGGSPVRIADVALAIRHVGTGRLESGDGFRHLALRPHPIEGEVESRLAQRDGAAEAESALEWARGKSPVGSEG